MEDTFHLAELCYWGTRCSPQDWPRAVELYQTAAAKGHLGAMYRLGSCYCDGEGVQQDFSLAIQLWKKAADRGDKRALVKLATCYERGEPEGFPQDSKAAWSLYAAAINRERKEQLQPQQKVNAYDRAAAEWKRNDGMRLESSLRSGSVVLLDAFWLVEYAEDARNRISYRQDLPEEAFLSLNEIVGATDWTTVHQELRIILLSYMWLHPNHPDPKGTTLALLAQRLKREIQCSLNSLSRCSTWGVFWDFASLHQHPDPTNNILRDSREQALFSQGLDSLHLFFSHPCTTVYKVTEFPTGYPSGYDLPDFANIAEYENRGWPFVESCWASLTKDNTKVEDLCREVGEQVRKPPLLLDAFESALSQCTFTNQAQDFPRVCNLYRASFGSCWENAVILNYARLGWMCQDLVSLSETFRLGLASRLTELCLDGNCIGPRGCQLIADGLGRSPPSTFRRLSLCQNPEIKDEGVMALKPVLPFLAILDLGETGIGPNACRIVAQHTTNKLNHLFVSRNGSIGDCGCKELVPVLRRLMVLDLSSCNVGNLGFQSLVDRWLQDEKPCLLSLDLTCNCIEEESIDVLCDLVCHTGSTLRNIDIDKDCFGSASRKLLDNLDGCGRVAWR